MLQISVTSTLDFSNLLYYPEWFLDDWFMFKTGSESEIMESEATNRKKANIGKKPEEGKIEVYSQMM